MLLSQDGIRRKALHRLVRQARQKVRYPSQWCATGQKPTPGRNPVIVLPVMLPWQAFGLAQFFIPVVMLVLWVIEPLLWPPAQRPHGPGSPGSHGDVPGCSAGATPLFSLERPPKTKPIFVEALSPKPGAEGLHTSVVCRLAWTVEVQFHIVQVRSIVETRTSRPVYTRLASLARRSNRGVRPSPLADSNSTAHEYRSFWCRLSNRYGHAHHEREWSGIPTSVAITNTRLLVDSQA